MIGSKSHPCDEVIRFGNTWHGLMAVQDLEVQIDDTAWPLPAAYEQWRDYSFQGPFADYGDSHVIRAPSAPLDITSEERDADRAAGIVWQDYSLLSGPDQLLYGQIMGGWIYVDHSGGRWLVQQASGPSLTQYGSIGRTSALGVGLELRRFGELESTEEPPLTTSAALANIGQANPDGIFPERGDTLRLRVTSIRSDGREAIIALYPSQTGSLQNMNPTDLAYGFLRLSLSGDESGFSASLQVLHSRSQVLGDRSSSTTGGYETGRLKVRLSGDITVTRNEAGEITRADGTWAYGGVDMLPTSGFPWSTRTPGGPPSFLYATGDRTFRTAITGRICGVVFDEADALVTITADIEDKELHDFTLDVNGSGGYAISGLQASITGSVGLSITKGDRIVQTCKITIRRNGSAVETYEYEFRKGATYSHQLDLGSSRTAGDSDEARFGILSVQYDLEAGTATDMSGVGSITAPYTVVGYIPGSAYTWSTDLSHGTGRVAHEAGTGYPLIGGSIATGFQRIGITARLSETPYQRIDVQVQRLSNQLWVTRAEKYTSSSASPSTAESRAVISPRGAYQSGVIQSHGLDRRYLTGSYEPVSGQVWVGYTNSLTDSVTWRTWI